jgi:intraflagellar transport protein 80
MKFKTTQAALNHHKDMVTAVCWTGGRGAAPGQQAELYSAGDDRLVTRWNLDGETVGKVCDLPEGTFVTDLSWFPGSSDTFAVSCTDGTFRLINKNGREDKRVSGVSLGAVITLKWNYDGSALATGGEDGCVKVYSRVGVPRYDPLVQAAHAVFSMAWSADSNQILFCSGDTLTIKTLQDSDAGKEIKWRAHDGTVMKVDWNPVNGLVVSGGEDRKYKVWDAFGRQLFQSQPLDHVVTCVSWSPRGDYFAVGSFDVLRLCDKLGWCHSRDRPQSGSLMSMSWTPDGMQLACAGANGAVVFANVVEKRVEGLKFEATQTEPNTICVYELKNEQTDQIDFRDRIVDWSIGFGHLVAATPNQCAIYATSNLNTPKAQMDLNAAPSLILQSPSQFAIVSHADAGGFAVFTYEGRPVCTPRFAGLRTEFLNSRVTSLTDDVLAVLDVTDSRTVHCFLTGRNGEPSRSVPIRHSHEIVDLCVSCNPDEPLLAFVDKNRDLYVVPVHPPSGGGGGGGGYGRRGASSKAADPGKLSSGGGGVDAPFKLHTMVDTISWNDQADILVALADSKLVTWYHPAVVYVDRDLLPATRVERDGTMFGKLAQITSFLGSRIKVRRADGAHLTTMIMPYPVELHKFVNATRWDEAVRLCRHCKSEAMWASLAAMAIHGLHLDTAEIALAATRHVDKLHFILYVKEIPSGAGRNAALALYQRRYEEAESILLQSNPPLLYRAIKMNVRLFKWQRALELAVNHKQHVDTVLFYRKKFLDGKEETDARFKQYFSEVELDEEALLAKREQEREQERSRSGGGSSSGGGGQSGY